MMKHCLLFSFCLAILLPLAAQDGTLDNGFGDAGIALYQDAGYTTTANAILVKPNGSILTIGERYSGFGSQLLFVGFTEDGDLDESFGSDNLFGNPTWGYPGIVHTDIPGSNREYAYAAALQPDGKFVVGGNANTDSDWLLARYDSNGDLDPDFANDGYLVQDMGGYDVINSLIILPNGQILAGGVLNGNLGVGRFNSDGSLDDSFGTDGLAILSATWGDGGRIATDGSGRIYICGTDGGGNEGRVLVGRFLSDGTKDQDFGNNGMLGIPSGEYPTTAFIAVGHDEKVVIASEFPANFGASYTLQLARLTVDGSPDMSFGDDGKRVIALGDFTTPADIAVQSDGTILVTGRVVISDAADMFVAKFKVNGSNDDTFGDNGLAVSGLGIDGFTNSALGLSIFLYSEDKVLAGGTARITGLDNLLLTMWHNSVGEPSGIFSPVEAGPLTCYPNPARETVYIDLPEGKWESLSVYDIYGRLIIQQQMMNKGSKAICNLAGLPSGMYTLSLREEGSLRTGRIFKE